MIIIDPMAISVKIPKIDSGCYLEKESIELIHKKPLMELCLNVNQVYLCHACVHDPLTSDTKDIL